MRLSLISFPGPRHPGPRLEAGCIKRRSSTAGLQRRARRRAAFDTIGDYELARASAQAGLVAVRRDARHLRPKNTDALFMLVKGWAGYGYGFVEDEMEAARVCGRRDLADYQRKRARWRTTAPSSMASQILTHQADGLRDAKKNEPDAPPNGSARTSLARRRPEPLLDRATPGSPAST